MEAARTAKAEDLDAITALAAAGAAAITSARGGARYLATESLAPPYEPTIAAAMTDPAALVVVGTIDEVPVGFAVVRLREGTDGLRVADVEALFVDPEARGVGVGEVMMDAVMGWAAAQRAIGVDAMALPGDRATKNFFESFGLVARSIRVHRAIADRVDGG